jgi:hypothetical protein
MHAAPSVSYPVGRSRFAAAVLASAWFAGLVAAFAWSAQADTVGWRQGLAGAALVASAAFAAAGWLSTPCGTIAWDGAEWNWQERGLAAASGRPQLVLDLQSRMLLQWVGSNGARRWLWVERKSDASHWAALRRALYSRASTPVPPSGKPPVAEQ